jgi:hypothetical protein
MGFAALYPSYNSGAAVPSSRLGTKGEEHTDEAGLFR